LTDVLTAKGYEVFSIFVVPPSEEVLKERLLKR
jgi:guanylate kinase